MSLACPRDAPTLPLLLAVDLHSLPWPSGPLLFLPIMSSKSPPLHPPPYPLSHPVLYLHLPPTTILFPLLGEIQAYSLGPSFLCLWSIVWYIYFMADIHL